MSCQRPDPTKAHGGYIPQLMGYVCLFIFVTDFFGGVNMKDWYCRLTSQGALCRFVFVAGGNTPGVWEGQGRSPERTPARTGRVRFSRDAGPSLGAAPPPSGSVPRDGPGRARRAGPPLAGRGKRLQAGRRTRGRRCEAVRKELREGGGAGWLSGASMCRLKPHPYYGRVSLAHFTSRRPRGTHGHR